MEQSYKNGILQYALPKFNLKIRLCLFLLTMILFQGHADTGYSQNAEVNLNIINEPLKVVFDRIETQSGFKFFYKNDDVDVDREVSVQFQKAKINEVLNSLFAKSNIIYEILGKQIILKKPFKKTQPFDRVITGKITNNNGEALAGATVIPKNSKSGVVADLDGSYSISVSDTIQSLVFSYTGYSAQEVQINGRSVIYVTMNAAVNDLDQVVIIGYGETTKKLNTGSVSTITKEEIQKQPVSDIFQSIRNRIPGLQITPNSGQVGAAPNIQIRGQNSIAAGTQPLILIDGVPVQSSLNNIGEQALEFAAQNLLYNLNPNDVEQIDVLKDADATAIYGSRGANGVILITTKKGGSSGLQLRFNTYTGFQTLPHKLNYLNVSQYQEMRREALANDGLEPDESNAADLLIWNDSQITNWEESFLGRTNIRQNLNVSLSGGNQNTHFLINAGYNKDGAISPGNRQATRKSIRTNINHESTDRRLNVDITAAYSIADLNLNQQSLISYTDLAPYYPIYDEDGNPNWDAAGFRGFPLAFTFKPYASQSKNYVGNMNLGYMLFEGFRLKVNAGYNSTVSAQSIKSPLRSLDPNSFENTPNARFGDYKAETWIVEPQLTYNVKLGRHKVDLLLGSTFQNVSNSSQTVRGEDYPNDALLGNPSSAETLTFNTSTSEYNYNSVFARSTYNFDDRYLVNLNFRRDGSSRFGPGKRFGNFGSVGGAWIFSNEAFLKDNTIFSFGKIRGSYGSSGNDQIQDYGYLSTYSSIGSGSRSYNGVALSPNGVANPDYRWEETRKAEIALESGFFNNRLLFNLNYFKDKSDNQLIFYFFSPQAGFNGYQTNFPATIENNGFEIQLTSTNFSNTDFSWVTAINFSKSQNKITRFDNIENTSYASSYEVGKSLSVSKAYEFRGLDNTGVPIIADLNNDGTLDSQDRKVIGDNDPQYGGIRNDFTFKNWSFSAFVDYTRDNNFFNIIPSRVGNLNFNTTTFFLNRWQQPGDENVTNIPKFTTSSSTYDGQIYGQSDIWWRTEHIFRLSNVSLAYNFPSKILDKINIEQARIYINAQNVYVWDKYKKERYDPLTGNGTTPPLRTITIGVNLTL